MSGYLLDTNCISELVRVKPAPSVMMWVEATDEVLLHLSVLTLGEIRKGVAGLPHGRRRTHLETWLEVELRARFAGRILPIDAAVADRWGCSPAAQKGTEERSPLSMACPLRRRFTTTWQSFHGM